ncbi:MAG: uracil-xanthine permease [Clostridia bacterium]|nr:uracil-xanthine permease [Clostridia bacterium]
MKLIYNVKDKPKFGQRIIFAFQQLLAIMAATIAVPAIVGNGMTPSAALFGAGVGTLVYLLFTKFRSPVFLGSSFAFLGSMFAAFVGAVSVQAGYIGLIIGAGFAGLVYVVIAIVVKFAGVKWIDRVMPAVVIGPTVAIIGLCLASNAVGDMMKGNVGEYAVQQTVVNGAVTGEISVFLPTASPYIALVCALVTLFVVILSSVYGKKTMKLIPFIIGIMAGYAVALCFTIIGNATGNDALKVINLAPFQNLLTDGQVTIETFLRIPKFTFLEGASGLGQITGSYIATVAVAYIPVAFVVFAEHLADHKNLSSIIEHDLLEDPGLHRSLLGDGIGSFAGAFFGGCPNTTYGESIGCVAITKNASVSTITLTAFLTMAVAFVSPFVAFLESIPNCVMGGVCMTLYGFIAVSGLKMVQKVDFEDNRNLFVVSVILIAGIGGLSLTFGNVTITEIACALILGIIVNAVVSIGKNKKKEN